jgi:hypothetical protein
MTGEQGIEHLSRFGGRDAGVFEVDCRLHGWSFLICSDTRGKWFSANNHNSETIGVTPSYAVNSQHSQMGHLPARQQLVTSFCYKDIKATGSKVPYRLVSEQRALNQIRLPHLRA